MSAIRQLLGLNAAADFGGLIIEGNLARVPATILFADLRVKGWTFSREELRLSAQLWRDKPVWVGSHTDKCQIGTISGAGLFGERLAVEFTIDTTELKEAGYAITDLSEVSLECRALSLGRDENDRNATSGRITEALGVVLLTDGPGECSSRDGCGLHLSECRCTEIEGEPMASKDEQQAKSGGNPLVDQLKGLTFKGLVALGQEAGIEQPSADEPDPEQVAEWRYKAEQFDKLELSRKQELVDRLIDGEHYQDSARENLMSVPMDELTERARLVGLGSQKPARTDRRRPLGSDVRPDRNARKQPEAAPRDFMSEIRKRQAARFGVGS